ncbi:hypothetical protein [Candidatus Erwinia dacicola]|uniref:Uncharacterized protein n=1 Tax=Candidatus Erwinia dacicola TaxID=252393 RepID=A0A1E7Z2A7_9GAMM|nr:hypothetical protein [Candidatus Erwinia dacicola]OFC62748.1 hypothetical protein BBW68_08265 [Candidatus Erwinia dacicola]RAP71628.1 hypothetical protein ACZ87_01555 [Candidatus Erwinia dacicola]
MFIPIIPEGMSLSLPPFNDINMRIILSYTIAKFTEDKNDSGLMARLAENFLAGSDATVSGKIEYIDWRQSAPAGYLARRN